MNEKHLVKKPERKVQSQSWKYKGKSREMQQWIAGEHEGDIQ